MLLLKCNKFTKCREQISIENKVINIDEIECQKFENCAKCVGSKETLKCSICKLGFKLNEDNFCIKPTCNVGKKEKCFSCKTDKGKDNECLKCNEGYYLSENDFDKSLCKKCQILKDVNPVKILMEYVTIAKIIMCL